MSLARLIITAVKDEGRTKSEVARDYGVSRYWVQTLIKRFEAEGDVRMVSAPASSTSYGGGAPCRWPG